MPLLFFHVGVAVVCGRHQSLLHGTRQHPADEVELAAGLVVGTGCAGSAERLHADNGSGGFVVDVEVAGSIFQPAGNLLESQTVAAPDGTGQAVRRGGVAKLDSLVHISVVIDVDCEDGAEDLLLL